MKRVRLGFIGTILLALIVASFGCGSSSDGATSSPSVISTPKTTGSLVFQVSTPHQINKRGVAIPIVFTVKNIGTETTSITFGGCYDFEAQIFQFGQPVNMGPSGLGCGAVIRPFTIAAGATQTYTYNWDQSSSIETFVADGNYTVTARLLPASVQGTPTDPTSNDFTTNPIAIHIAD